MDANSADMSNFRQMSKLDIKFHKPITQSAL